MADNKKTTDDLMTSDDPQADVAAEGWDAIFNMPIVKQALDFEGNLKNQYDIAGTAAQGDPEAQRQLADSALGTAIGSLKIGGPSKPIYTTEAAGIAETAPGAIQKLEQALGATKPIEAVELAKQVDQAAQAGQMTQKDLAMAMQKANRPKRYAEGGEVMPQIAPESYQVSNEMPQMSAPEPAILTDSPINVINPGGQLVSIPTSDLESAINSGYRQATEQDVHNYVQDLKYGSTEQQLIAGLEGAAEGATFGLSTGAETALGVNPEDIRGRREQNPGSHMLGQMAGIAGSSLIPGVGAAGLLEKAGAGTAKALGLTGGSGLSRIGSGAVKNAVETMMVQGGDEVSKMFAQDPHQSVGTAMADIGLAGVLGGGIGGALGTVPALWKATTGSKVGQFLDNIARKVGGIEGVIPDEIETAIQRAGIDISPEVKASLSNDPAIQTMFQQLQESTTKSGLKAQEALKNFRGQAAEALVNTLGKTSDDVAALANLSEYEAGESVKKALIDNLKSTMDPISERFNKIKSQYSKEELPNYYKESIGTKLGQLGQDEGYSLSQSSAANKLLNTTIEEISNLKTLEDLRRYQSIVGDKTFGNLELRRAGNQIKKILREAEEDTVMGAAGRAAPAAIEEHLGARAAYRDAMNMIDDLNERLHVGKYNGPDSFVKALKEMSPEDVIRRLSPKGDAGVIGAVFSKFPAVGEQVKDYYLGQSLRTAASRAGAGEAINAKTLFNALDKMSPEMRKFLIPETAAPRVDAIKALVEGLPAKMNNSGTAKTLDALWNKVPESAVAIASALAGHNPISGYLIGHAGKLLARDAPDAVRLGLLKFLGSGQKIESEGFKAMVDFAQHTINGENLLAKATKNLFKAGMKVIPESYMPTERDRAKLDKALKNLQANQNSLMEVGGKTSHYLPDHGAAIAQTASNAVNYLNSLRPAEERRMPLDPKPVVNAVQKAKYERALDIAQQPLSVLDRIQKGTILPEDIIAMQQMYPGLYKRVSAKLMDNMINEVSKGVAIPYQTKIGLSLFMGQPLDSTMTPQGIQSAQPAPSQPPSQPQPKMKHSTAKLGKMNDMYQTGPQAREAAHLKD